MQIQEETNFLEDKTNTLINLVNQTLIKVTFWWG